ncbi:MAG: hypothetical protein PF437_10310 [Sulfurimonas sp.]|jgi:hypothetical protein|nr:hypothetical protein [Sulfurimonas sp.]
MKTMQLLTLLLGITILSSLGSAQEIKPDALTKKVSKAKQETTKNKAKKSVDDRLAPKAYQKADWT